MTIYELEIGEIYIMYFCGATAIVKYLGYSKYSNESNVNKISKNKYWHKFKIISLDSKYYNWEKLKFNDHWSTDEYLELFPSRGLKKIKFKKL
jgi:hypothetical protein